MTIFEYLTEKYGESGPKVLSFVEAQHFRVAYPLQKGWLEEHGHKAIPPETAFTLAAKLYIKGNRSGSVSKSNYCLAGAAILRRIGKAAS